MPFDSVGWETPIGTYSVSFISHSTKSPSRRFDVATTYPLAAKRAKRRPNATDKYDSNDDIIPAATDCSILTTAQDAAAELFIAEKSAELIEKHHQEFIKRAFSVRALAADVSLTTVSASIKMCRLQRRTLTISSMSSRIGVWV
jgi:phage terminase Nu1 subunit (DNA packaging protein)